MEIIISDTCAYMLESDGEWSPVARPYYSTPGTTRPKSVSWDDPEEMRPATREMLPLIGRTLRRMLPSTPVHLVPRVLDLDLQIGPDAAGNLGGYAHHGLKPAIVLSQQCHAWGLLDCAMHEAFHIYDRCLLDSDDRRVVYRAVRGGVPLPAGYYDSEVERAARAFSAWGCLQLSLAPLPQMPRMPRKRTMERVFWEVLTGSYDRGSAMSDWLSGRAGKI